MSRRLLGIGASPGRARGPVRWVEWDIPAVPHRTIAPEQVEAEVRRFEEAREWARERIRELRDAAVERVGPYDAKIFESQLLMLDDPDLVEGTLSYVRDNYLSAERAFDWRLLEIRSRFLDTAHAMVLDRLADLRDIRFRVLGRLLGLGEDPVAVGGAEPAVLLFEELTPSLAVRLQRESVLGLLTVGGSRTSHSAVLARSMGIPAVVNVGAALRNVENGTIVLLDGASGRIVVDPTGAETAAYAEAVERLSAWQRRQEELASRPTRTSDGERVRLLANLDQPDDMAAAVRVGAEGVGLFRSEFLVLGRRTIPTEDEQYEAYREVVEGFPDDVVTLRTFDIGGDKFPIFLEMPPEENPYLGWRAIRVCLDLPDLFRNQLRAAVRASLHGRLRILLPFIVSVEEIRRTRNLLREVMEELDFDADVPLGIMVETAAALETLDLLAPHVDFLSLGTNDLTQYVVAVDRGNPRLSALSDPLHPALFRLYRRLRDRAADFSLELGVCGDLATDPLGVAALLGLGYRSFSLPPISIPEIQAIVRSVSAAELEEITRGLTRCESAGEIRAHISLYLEGAVPFEAAAAARLSAV